MAVKLGSHDWSTDSYSHSFPRIPTSNSDLIKILKLLKEYDKTCSEARARMIKQINEVLGNKNPTMTHLEKST
jgi:hypothetical protein